MAPEKKPIISTIEEMVCDNCVFSAEKNSKLMQKKYTVCHNAVPAVFQESVFEGLGFCSEGMWRIIIAMDRVSVVPFVTAYDYLSKDKN